MLKNVSIAIFMLVALANAASMQHDVCKLWNVQRTSSDEYVGDSDKGRVKVHTSVCRFDPVKPQTAILDVYKSSDYKTDAYIRFENQKVLYDPNQGSVCEVVKVTRE
jgi:hypothetical protein